MATGQFLRMGFTATDNSLPKFFPNDGILTNGSKFLIDAGKKACYPSQAANLPVGTVLKNLVTGAPDAAVEQGALTYEGGALVFSGGRLVLGTSYGLAAAGNPDALWIIWAKLATSTAGYQGLLQRAELSNPEKAEFHIDLGETGNTFRGTVWQSDGAGLSAPNQVVSRNQVIQLAVSIQGGKIVQWINSGKTGEAAFTKPYNTPAVNHPVSIGGYGGFSPFTGKVYRAYHENLTQSGRTAADVVAMDYQGNVSRFV